MVATVDLFVIPIGNDRYELYCEQSNEPPLADAPATGIFGRLRHRFTVMLHAAEERQRNPPSDSDPPRGWAQRLQERCMAWVAERVAEQRLLWNLRHETAVVAAHPQDMTFDQVLALIKGMLKRDYNRHRLWLVIDTLLLLGSAVLAPVPGPNLIAYYFAFRVVGHWLSLRGARQGLDHISWSGRACEPLTELRGLASMEPEARVERVHAIAASLSLRHLSTFFERVAIP
jgi:hypothetical protein